MNDFVVVALDGMPANGIATCVDLLHAARASAPHTGAPLPSWRVVSPFGGRTALRGGFAITTESMQLARHTPDTPPPGTWVIPDPGLANKAEVLAARDAAPVRSLVHALRLHSERGGRIAATGSAVFLLAFADLLSGRRVSVAPRWTGLLHAMDPSCRIEESLPMCSDGNLLTVAAPFAQAHAMLQLLRTRAGDRLADALCRELLPGSSADARGGAEPRMRDATLTGRAASGQELVSRIVARVEGLLPRMPTVAALAEDLCVSRRTLGRHVRRITGESTNALLQDVRLRRARVLLEQSRMPVEQVAAAVGYEDSTALRRLMRKRCGVTPGHYRPEPHLRLQPRPQVPAHAEACADLVTSDCE